MEPARIPPRISTVFWLECGGLKRRESVHWVPAIHHRLVSLICEPGAIPMFMIPIEPVRGTPGKSGRLVATNPSSCSLLALLLPALTVTPFIQPILIPARANLL